MTQLLPPVIGHRGAMAHAPENTLVSIREAARLGARAVEIDVALTADRQAVLLHDPLLDRTTDGHGHLDEISLSELARLDAGGWFDRRFAGEPVPELAAAIELMLDLDLGLNLEIKPLAGHDVETARVAMATLVRLWPAERPRPVVSSFSIMSLAAARALAPDWPLSLLVRGLPKDWRTTARALGCQGIHAGARVLRASQAAEIKAAGYFLGCYTVNRPSLAAKLFSWGVDAVFTDAPDLILPEVPR